MRAEDMDKATVGQLCESLRVCQHCGGTGWISESPKLQDTRCGVCEGDGVGPSPEAADVIESMSRRIAALEERALKDAKG